MRSKYGYIWVTLALFVFSPQSKEGDERKEEKLDWIMRQMDREGGGQRIRELDEKFPRA